MHTKALHLLEPVDETRQLRAGRSVAAVYTARAEARLLWPPVPPTGSACSIGSTMPAGVLQR